jgi:hypothetical protein
LFDKFISLKEKSCLRVVLNKRNIEYHYTNEFAPRRVISFEDSNKTEPMYFDSTEVYLIELTDDSGYLCLVATNNKNNI